MQDSNEYFVIAHRALADFGRAVLEAVKVPREQSHSEQRTQLVSANLRSASILMAYSFLI